MRFKSVFTWVLGILFVCYLLFIFVWFTRLGIAPQIVAIIEKQWLAMIVFPSACFAALVAVMVLQHVTGEIEFKAVGFEFKGAAAPIVMWAMLILVFSVSLNLLWQK